mgnify:CR=1 FL=1
MKEQKNKLFVSCDEAKYICDKSQYSESTFWERLQLKMRYAYCHITRAYVKRNKKLSELIQDQQVTCMDATKKADLKIKFTEELQNK